SDTSKRHGRLRAPHYRKSAYNGHIHCCRPNAPGVRLCRSERPAPCSASRIDDNLPRWSVEKQPLLVEHVAAEDAFSAGGKAAHSQTRCGVDDFPSGKPKRLSFRFTPAAAKLRGRLWRFL